VKLDAPEKIFDREDLPETQKDIQPKPEVNWGKRNLTLVASLILIVCCSLMVYLGFQRITAPGGALAEGDHVSAEESTAPEQDKPEESTETAVSSEKEDTRSCEAGLTSYTQRGDTIMFSLALTSVPEAYFDHRSLEAVLVQEDQEELLALPITLEDQSALIFGAGYEAEGEMYVYGMFALDEVPDTLSFYVQVESSDKNAPLLVSNDMQLEPASLDSYMTWDTTGFEFIADDLEPSAYVTRMEITPERMAMTVRLPETELDGTPWIHTLTRLFEEQYIVFNLEDGTQYGFDQGVDLTQESFTTREDGYSIMELSMDLSSYDLDPLDIQGFQWSNSPVSAYVDEDGLLTAQLDLPFSIGESQATLIRFTLDLSTGLYTWYADIPELLDMLYAVSTQGDFGLALGDTTFSQLHTDFENIALADYKCNAYLVFTNGTELCLGSGDIIGFEDELFTDSGKIAWAAADNNTDVSDLTPAYLRIGDTTYELQ
jgi:hypothetical protein